MLVLNKSNVVFEKKIIDLHSRISQDFENYMTYVVITILE